MLCCCKYYYTHIYQRVQLLTEVSLLCFQPGEVASAFARRRSRSRGIRTTLDQLKTAGPCMPVHYTPMVRASTGFEPATFSGLNAALPT